MKGLWGSRHLAVFVGFFSVFAGRSFADKEFWWMGQEGTFGQGSNQGQAVQQGSGASPNYQGGQGSVSGITNWFVAHRTVPGKKLKLLEWWPGRCRLHKQCTVL